MKQSRKNSTNGKSIPLFASLKERLRADRPTVAILGVTFVAAVVIVVVSTQFGSVLPLLRVSDYRVGSVAERDYVVERDILYLDEEATRLKREAAGKLVLPIFRVNERIGEERLQRFSEFRDRLIALSRQESALDTIFLRLQVDFPGILSREQLARLLETGQLNAVFAEARLILDQLFETGLVKLPEQDSDLLSSGAVELWRWTGGRLVKEEVSLEEVLTRGNLEAWIEERFPEVPAQLLTPTIDLVRAFAVENGFYDAEETESSRRKVMEEVEPVQAKLVKDQVIVRRGDIVDAETAAQIRALGEYSVTVNLNSIAGNVLFLLAVFLLALFLFQERVVGLILKRNQIVFLAATALIFLLAAALLGRFFTPGQGIPMSVILPTATVSILVTLIVCTRAGIALSLILALLVLPLTGMDPYALLFVLLTGVAGTAVVQQAERRIDLVRAGLYLSAVNIVLLVLFVLLQSTGRRWLLPVLGWGFLNGFASSMISLGFLPILEHALNTASRFRLIELSDLNAPILKRMLSLAPGTYNHSISVANLAESACSAIGANALLARVGAYYHDIGKIEQAEYFIENQTSYNKHDDLKPSLSAAVIKSHLKVGIEKARELALPQEVQDIIAQHHGRGIIQYFYQRAVDNGNSANVSSDDYSYQGYRPRSREAAVVMLADAVEAATRTLKKPTVAKLEKLVWDMIMEKFTSQELSDSQLTFRNLETIKKSFVQVLAGYYHSRIEYPKVKEAAR
ncbi:MAG: HDIG domain-containing protein [Spirochaetales bacterium]|nr:HDIG domain-containing protein [Spirochaetales bacterium]